MLGCKKKEDMNRPFLQALPKAVAWSIVCLEVCNAGIISTSFLRRSIIL